MSFVLGLTGSIGMGKSTTAQIFADFGVPVWDADAAVHRLYSSDEEVIGAVGALAPDAVVNGAISREVLKLAIKADAGLLKQIEAVVHPAVAADRQSFLAINDHHPLVVLDIPLIYETGQEARFDAVAVVTIDAATQAERVLARAGMTKENFEMILSRQMPDAEKRAKADYIIETKSLDHVRGAVHDLITKLGGKDA